METFVGIPLLGDGSRAHVATLPPHQTTSEEMIRSRSQDDAADSVRAAPAPLGEAPPPPPSPQVKPPPPSIPKSPAHGQRPQHTEDPAELAQMQLQYEKALLEHQLKAVSEDRDKLRCTVHSLTTSLQQYHKLVLGLQQHLPEAEATAHARGAAAEEHEVSFNADLGMLSEAAERYRLAAAAEKRCSLGEPPAASLQPPPAGATEAASPPSRPVDEAQAPDNAGQLDTPAPIPPIPPSLSSAAPDESQPETARRSIDSGTPSATPAAEVQQGERAIRRAPTDDFWQSVTPPLAARRQGGQQQAMHNQAPQADEVLAEEVPQKAVPSAHSEPSHGGSASKSGIWMPSPFAAESGGLEVACTPPDIGTSEQQTAEQESEPPSCPSSHGMKASPREQLQQISDSLCRRQDRLAAAPRSPGPGRSEQQSGQATRSSSFLSPYPSAELMASPKTDQSSQPPLTPPNPLQSFVGYGSGAGRAIVHLPSRASSVALSPAPSPLLASPAQSPSSQLLMSRTNPNSSRPFAHASISSSPQLLRAQDAGPERAHPHPGLHRYPWSSQGELAHPQQGLSRTPSAWDPGNGSGSATPAAAISRSPFTSNVSDFLKQQQLTRMDDHALLLQVLDVAVKERCQSGALDPLDALLYDDGHGSSFAPEGNSSAIAGMEEECRQEQRIDELEDECTRLRAQVEQWRNQSCCFEQRCKSLETTERDLEKQLARMKAGGSEAGRV